MNDLPLEVLLALIGGKEVDLLLLRRENAELRKRLSEAETKLADKGNVP